MKSCIVLFTTVPEYWDDEKTRPLHSYMGSFCHKNPVYYVESYKNGNIKVTYGKDYSTVVARILNILMGQGFPKPERLVEAKFGETTGALYVVNSTHRVEMNCVGLTFLMQLQLKQLWEDSMIKLWNIDSGKKE